jgi:hypothetical protein
VVVPGSIPSFAHMFIECEFAVLSSDRRLKANANGTSRAPVALTLLYAN